MKMADSYGQHRIEKGCERLLSFTAQPFLKHYYHSKKWSRQTSIRETELKSSTCGNTLTYCKQRLRNMGYQFLPNSHSDMN